MRQASFWRARLEAVVELDLDPGRAEPLGAAARDSALGSRAADDDARDPAASDRVDAGRRAPVVGAGLERDVERRPARALARRLERGDLGVRPAAAARASPRRRPRRRGRRRRRRPGSGRRPAPPLGELERPRAGSAPVAWTRVAGRRAAGPRGRRSRAPRRTGSRPLAQRADVLRPDAAVDLDVHPAAAARAAARIAVERLGHERLPRVARMDAHAEHEVDRRLARRVRRLVRRPSPD